MGWVSRFLVFLFSVKLCSWFLAVCETYASTPFIAISSSVITVIIIVIIAIYPLCCLSYYVLRVVSL